MLERIAELCRQGDDHSCAFLAINEMAAHDLLRLLKVSYMYIGDKSSFTKAPFTPLPYGISLFHVLASETKMNLERDMLSTKTQIMQRGPVSHLH